MPFDVGDTVNSIADSVTKAPIITSIVRNPIYTALMITLIIVFIIMFIFRDADTDDSLLIMCLRSGFWIFLMLLGVLFLHNKALTAENNLETKNAAFEQVFNGSYSNMQPGAEIPPSLAGMVVPVQISPQTINAQIIPQSTSLNMYNQNNQKT